MTSMTTPPADSGGSAGGAGARSRRRRRGAILIALLVPILIAGAFIAALAQPQDHFDRVVAAVVNTDEPVELEGQLAPLGRQLAAALVDGQGMDDVEGGVQNFTWVMTNSELAREGLDSGEYSAVVTIPPGFSAAATSTAEADSGARQAMIDVEVSPRARLADEAITHTLVRAAVDSLGNELTSTYLDNVFIGFNTLGEELGTAADGARTLASGADELAGGTGELADGMDQLAQGTGELAGGTGELLTGVTGLRSGTAQLSSGTGELARGAQELTAGSRELAAGAEEFSAGMGELTGGAEELSGGLSQINDAVGDAGEFLDQVEAGLVTGAGEVRELADQLGGATGAIDQVVTQVCAADPGGEACAILQEYLGGPEDIDALLGQAAAGLGVLADYMEGLSGEEEGIGQIQQLFTALDALDAGASDLAGGLQQARGGAGDLAGGARDLAGGSAALTQGIRDLHGGAQELDSGVGELHSGVNDLDVGAGELAAASGEAAAGADDLAEGSEDLAGGTEDLADGLGEATGEIPNYPDGTRQSLADVIADPMTLEETGGVGFRWLAFFSVVALWAGGLWLLRAYPAVAPNAGTSTRSAASLTVASLKIPALIALLQGAGVGVLVAAFTDISAPLMLGFAALAALMSVAFMAVQRGLVAHLGWGGVAITVVIGAIAVATALISAMPPFASTVVAWLPVGPAISAAQSVEFSLGAWGGPVLGLLAWAGAGAGAVLLATRRAQRT